MPSFDEWGLRPVGLEGPREILDLVVPLPAVTLAFTPEVGAGGDAEECQRIGSRGSKAGCGS